MEWKSDWSRAKQHHIDWWNGKGMVAAVYAPSDAPREGILPPHKPPTTVLEWLDPAYRSAKAEYSCAQRFYGGDSFPMFETDLGAGGLGTFVGAHPNFTDKTVWFEPCIFDVESYGAIRFNPQNQWWQSQIAIIDEGVRRARGRYLVGMPDLIENLDTLAAMRGTEQLLFDLIERPDWVLARQEEILPAYKECFDLIHGKIKDADGGNCFVAFQIWGPGRVAKLQCDISCMLSPEMFNRFVLPYLKRQADWLDYSMYHLDGTTALQHLDALLSIDSLHAIQWTPQDGKPQPGEAVWYDLYKRIKAGGKSVQANGVRLDQIRPLLDAVGPEGMYIKVNAKSQKLAEEAVDIVEQYR